MADSFQNLLEYIETGSKNTMLTMGTGAKKIHETGELLTEVSENISNSIQTIGKQIHLFKV